MPTNILRLQLLARDQADIVQTDVLQNLYCDVFSYPSLNMTDFWRDTDKKVVNPYQKPLALYLRLLKMFAMPGSTVLDVTCGTGSLEVAALERTAPGNLHIVVIDKNVFQFNECKRRLGSVCVEPVDKNNVQPDVESEDAARTKMMKKAGQASGSQGLGGESEEE